MNSFGSTLVGQRIHAARHLNISDKREERKPKEREEKEAARTKADAKAIRQGAAKAAIAPKAQPTPRALLKPPQRK